MYCLVSILSSITTIACIYLLSEVISLLVRLNLFMQRNTSDFSKLPIMLSSIVHQLTSLKEPGTDWCIDADKAISNLEKEHGIAVKTTIAVTRIILLLILSVSFKLKLPFHILMP